MPKRKKKSTKAKPVTNNRGRKFPSKSDAIRAYLKTHPDGTVSSLKNDWGIMVASGAFSTVRTGLSRGGIVKKRVTKKSRKESELDRLKLRVQYLEWVREGERLGFVSQLIAEVADE